MFTSFDTGLIAERNAQLLREVRAEQFRKRSRKERGPSAHRISRFLRYRRVIGQETAAERA